MLANIFNNGSKAWILIVLAVAWAAIWGYKAYKSHKSGYQRQNPNGTYTTVKGSLWSNPNFLFGLIGTVALLAFAYWINSDYK